VSGPHRTRTWGWQAGGLLALALAAVAVALAPRVARDMDAFRVDQVEVLGTRFLEPYAVVRAAGLDRGANVFDDPGAWRSGVLALSLVAEVAVRRRLPSTIIIEVREVEPAALVAGDRLQPVDAEGRAIDLDPAGTVLDLPILVGAELVDGVVTGDLGPAGLRLLGLLREHQPSLAERLSQIEAAPSGIRLAFRDGGPEALLPLAPTPDQLVQFRVAYADLAARGELRRARRIDVRFRDQVVVSFLRTPVS
jgi:cell division protein FtsQ